SRAHIQIAGTTSRRRPAHHRRPGQDDQGGAVTAVLLVVAIVLALSLAGLGTVHLTYRRKRPGRLPTVGARRILFPFVANALSERALDASLRLARAEGATLVPVFLARVPLHL